MKTIILCKSFSFLIPMFLFFSVFMFIRGHDLPGGGFIAGLLASTPFIIHGVVFGVAETRNKYRLNQLAIAGVGLLVSIVSGLFGMAKKGEYMQTLWMDEKMPIIGKLGTPILFDAGVYMIVFGIFLQIAFLFTEDVERSDP